MDFGRDKNIQIIVGREHNFSLMGGVQLNGSIVLVKIGCDV
jgi:hypothetical protein